ncbi:MAG: fibronectin type III domain-containing protein [Verrucomicrobiia bacterium]
MQFPTLASTTSATLAWNPSADSTIAGYNLYYGAASHAYTKTNSVGVATNATISGLVEGKTYYFAATTYSADGTESPFSSELVYRVPIVDHPPALNVISNLTIMENSGSQTVSLTDITSSSSTKNPTLAVTAVSSSTTLIPNPLVNYTNPNTTGFLTLKPAPNRIGTAVIAITIKDGGTSNNIVTRTFIVTVVSPTAASVNRRPALGCQLTNQVALSGQIKTFTIRATGQGLLKYQWNYNGTILPAAVNSVLTLKNVTPGQSGIYSVTVTDRNGSTNSSAFLTVYATTAANLTPTTFGSGEFALALAGVPGYKYAVQASTNLVDWVPLQTNTAPFTFVDVNAGNFSQRFYRSVYRP